MACLAQAGTCKGTTVNSQADASKLASCKIVKGNLIIGSESGASIDISGPEQITGDLRVEKNEQITTLMSTTLQTVGGQFKLNKVTGLNTVDFGKLTTVQSIYWVAATRLDTVTLGPLTKAETIRVSDTFLSSLDGFALKSVGSFNIDNNRRLQKYTSQLTDLSDELVIQANGIDLEVDLSNLNWIANMAIANVTKFSVPSLKVVNGSAKFDSNYFTSFSAPNLTKTETGDISFVGNGFLKNMTFPKLTEIAGGLLIANNTGLDRITFFPKLEKISGAVKLRGNFTE